MIREIVSIEPQHGGKRRIVFDTQEKLLLYPKEAAAYSLEEGTSVDQAMWDTICTEVLLPRAKRRCMHLLERMDRTEHQMRDKLLQDGYPAHVADEVIRYVMSYHYIDDLRYANTYIRLNQDKKSRRQLKAALQQKGIHSEVIDDAMEESLTADPKELIRKHLDKKGYNAEAADRREQHRLYQSLLRKGFSSSDILHVMDLY